MKKLTILLAVLLGMASCANNQFPEDSDYHAMIRLWFAQHMDENLNAEMMAAFDKYPGCCDEVWFEHDGLETQQFIDESLPKMVAAAEKVRQRGITPSIQVVAIGHPEPVGVFPNDPASLQKNKLGFRPVVSEDGYAATTQTCPRDTAFANEHAKRYAIYAEAIQPYAIYIDDDLRLTQHTPAHSICFCDECLKQFSEKVGKVWTREALVKALNDNEPGVRKAWIRFSQEGLAVYTRIVSQAVHKVSPNTHMGLQHVAFHEELMEGWDWTPIFDAMREATGLAPVSRPGHGYYNDRVPREMFIKAYGISRQIHRLPSDITSIAPEIEGYMHRATGKSPQSICTETLLYLGLGATSMSYAIICANMEPMEWYAENYFKYLDKYHSLFSQFTAFNKTSYPCGIDSYLSPNQVYRNTEDWAVSRHGQEIIQLAAYGVTLTPESPWCTATTLDSEAVQGMQAAEVDSLFNTVGVLMDKATWDILEGRGYTASLKKVDKGYVSASGKRIAVCPSYNQEITGAERNAILDQLDWVSDDKMYCKFESMVHATAVPRCNEDGTLRSVVYVNSCISDQENIVIRLRHCPADAKFIWKSAGNKDLKLKAVKDGEDFLVTIPFAKAWDAAWIAVI